MRDCEERIETEVEDILSLNLLTAGSHVDQLLDSLHEIKSHAHQECRVGVELLCAHGTHLISDEHYAVDSIEPKCIEMRRVLEGMADQLNLYTTLLEMCQQWKQLIDRCEVWMEYGLPNSIGNCEEMIRDGNTLLSLLDHEVESIGNDRLESDCSQHVILKQFEEKMEQLKCSIQQILMSLCHQLTTLRTSLQTHSNNTNNNKHEKYGKNKKSQRKPSIEVLHGSDQCSTDSAMSHDSSGSEIHSLPLPTEPGGSGGSYESDQVSPLQSRTITDRMSSCLHTRLGHVMKELVSTELVYVSELENIVKGYCERMVDKDVQHLVSPQLKDNHQILFSNLKDIYLFHKNVFMRDLQACQHTPALVGSCFIKRRAQFGIYSIYCQNKHHADRVRLMIGDNHPFLQHCQQQLGHRLPLSAYLLKPVQRITKYQLLIKEMLKCSQCGLSGYEELEEALDCILSVLKHVNDVMHESHITGLPGNLGDYGDLVMQGAVNVWLEQKLRFKPRARHVFLYPHVLVLCKRRDENKDSDKSNTSTSYRFKEMIELTSDLSVIENVKGDKRKLEILSGGRREISITLQANSVEAKETWVCELVRVLQEKEIRNNVKDDSGGLPLNKQRSMSSSWIYEPMSRRFATFNNNHQFPPVRVNKSNSLTGHGEEEKTRVGDDEEDEGWLTDEDGDAASCTSSISTTPLSTLQVLTDYAAVDVGELSVTNGEVVEVLKAGSHPANGWLYCRLVGSREEGWVPADHLTQYTSPPPLLRVKRRGKTHYSSNNNRLSTGSTSSNTSSTESHASADTSLNFREMVNKRGSSSYHVSKSLPIIPGTPTTPPSSNDLI